MDETGESSYVVAGVRPWNRRTFELLSASQPGQWTFVDSASELAAVLQRESPRYVFFLHWSTKVPDDIVAGYECVVFHMTDVPFGRGGTPLQNLITRGFERTKLTALRMTRDIDAGPVYAQAELDLHGTAESVYVRADRLAAELIALIVREMPTPRAQVGEVVAFQRRTAAESEVPLTADLDVIHDFIRMLDAEGYPTAFVEHGPIRIELRRAARYDGRVEADARIVIRDADT